MGHNDAQDAVDGGAKKRRVRIFDTTLRDGEQTPGISMSPDQKLAIARRLDALGVDVIEAGFPVVSDGEHHAVSMIASDGLSCEIAGLARANKNDIDSAADAGLSYVHTFIATSDIHLASKLKMTRQEALKRAVGAVEYAKSRGMTVEFSAEDATRTDRGFLTEVFTAVASAGADRIDIPDTVGYATPEYVAAITRDAISASRLPVSVHCHNDFGLAVANALSGIRAGAECAHVTINGIGERAGNASLEELTMALKCLSHAPAAGPHDAAAAAAGTGEGRNGAALAGTSYETGIVSEQLYDVSRYVSSVVGMQVQPNKAIVGENAFGHESGIHTHGVLSNPLTYEPISPELVGRKRRLYVGKHAGIHGMNAMLAEYGITPDAEQSVRILEKVKALGDKSEKVSDVELLSFASEVIGDRGIKRLVKLAGFSVSTGIGTMPYAFVKLDIDGTEFSGTDYGVGPVDAALNAIERITDKTSELRIKDYGLASISGGSAALCEVTISVEDARGNSVSAKSVGKDIVTTSVRAVIEGINRIMLKRLVQSGEILSGGIGGNDGDSSSGGAGDGSGGDTGSGSSA